MSRRRIVGPAALGSLGAVLGAALATLFVAGCPPVEDCRFEGKGYRAGESFARDCNTCSCTASGQVLCTTQACAAPICRRTGCSGTVCSDHDVVTTCEWNNVYACYQGATCALQPDGTCGFSPSAALAQCLAQGGPADAGASPDAAPPGKDAATNLDTAPGKDAGAQKPCVRGGCSGQICSENAADIVTTCEWREEYGCYQQAACERQSDGQCGFTPSDALSTCLANAHGQKDAGAPTTDARPPVDGGVCDFQGNYEYGAIGGFVAYSDRTFLAPGNKYRHVRTPVRGGVLANGISCEPAMPACNNAYEVTAFYVERFLAAAEVRAALAEATPPLFGVDTRPVDGTVFEFKSDKGSFLVGQDCNGSSACRPVPTGVRQLVQQLLQLDRERLATDACKAAGFTQ